MKVTFFKLTLVAGIILFPLGCRDSRDKTSHYDLTTPKSALKSFVSAMEAKEYGAAAEMIWGWDKISAELGGNVKKTFEKTGQLGPYPPETLIKYCRARIDCEPKFFQDGTKAEFRTLSEVTGMTNQGAHESDQVELYKGSDGLWRIGDFD